MICITSPHEKGFWQADVYFEDQTEGTTPDWFATGLIGGTRKTLIEYVHSVYPGIAIAEGVTGVCIDCGEEFTALLDTCPDCGGCIGDS